MTAPDWTPPPGMAVTKVTTIGPGEKSPKWVLSALKASKLEIQVKARELLLPRLHTVADIADGNQIAYAEIMNQRGEVMRVAREPTIGERLKAIEVLAKIATILTEADGADGPDDDGEDTPKEIQDLATRAVDRLEEFASSLARHRRDAAPVAGDGEAGAASPTS